MELNINLTVVGAAERQSGFRYFWLKNVVDYRLDVHCARSLVGSYDRRISKDMLLNHPVPLRGELVYLCGVAFRGYHLNFHAAARYRQGAHFEVPMFNGNVARFDNAERIEITPLPDGWGGLPKAFTTCRNFQFAVQMSGASAANTSS